jgi:SEC-C motif-containing protein
MYLCPCGSQNVYSACCGRFIENFQHPSSPEELMRSRYTAYTLGNIDYIARTMKPPASNDFDPDSAREWAQQATWIKLDVLNTSLNNTKGIVEFQAHYSLGDKIYVLHEVSEFHLLDGLWYYVDGKIPAAGNLSSLAKRTGRNNPCLCGSGKKFKKCCGR